MAHPAAFLLLASAFAQVPAPAAPADPTAAEQVLREAGLTLLSNSYILAGEMEASQAASVIKQAEGQLAALTQQIRPLEQRHAAAERRQRDLGAQVTSMRREARRLRDFADGPNEAARRQLANQIDNQADQLEETADDLDRQMRDAERQAAPLVDERNATSRELQRLQLSYRGLVAEALRRYALLAADPRIKAALRTLNRGRQPKLALGPVDAYQENVLKASLEILAALGLREERGVFLLPEGGEFVENVSATELLQREAGMHERNLQELKASPAPAEEPARKAAALLADRRKQLAERVPELRKMADALRARQNAMIQDVEVRDALAVINQARRTRVRLGEKPGFQVSLQKLEEMEAALRTGDSRQ